MTVLTPNLIDFLEEHPVGVLGLRRSDGSVHQSLVYHVVRDGKVHISTEPTRVKGRIVQRDGWASYAVRGEQKPYPSFTLEGPATLLQGDGIGELTSQLFELIFDSPLDEPFTDEKVREMNRAIIEITPEKVYAVSHLQA